MPSSGWQPRPQRLVAPRPGEVHVWIVSPSREAAREEQWRRVLRPDERMRADRFHFARDRLSFTITRGVLRALLGGYLRVAPEEVRFAANPYGKPVLGDAHSHEGLRFNVSHSGDCSLLALAGGVEVGVDVEQLGRGADLEMVARSLFPPSANARLQAVPSAERERAFLETWTWTEAVIKAAGWGLSVPRESFEAILAVELPPRVRCAAPGAEPAGEWSVRPLDPGGAYVAALAAEAGSRELRLWSWS